MRKTETVEDVQRWSQEAIRDLWPIARGSICWRRSPCIRENCSTCASGEGHAGYALAGYQGKRRFSVYASIRSSSSQTDGSRQAPHLPAFPKRVSCHRPAFCQLPEDSSRCKERPRTSRNQGDGLSTARSRSGSHTLASSAASDQLKLARLFGRLRKRCNKMGSTKADFIAAKICSLSLPPYGSRHSKPFVFSLARVASPPEMKHKVS
jgi:hypothetical protein